MAAEGGEEEEEEEEEDTQPRGVSRPTTSSSASVWQRYSLQFGEEKAGPGVCLICIARWAVMAVRASKSAQWLVEGSPALTGGFNDPGRSEAVRWRASISILQQVHIIISRQAMDGGWDGGVFREFDVCVLVVGRFDG